MDKIGIIKSSLAMSDVISYYGFKVARGEYICCPFHSEKTPSMKIFKTGFHCYGCHEGGDVINFIRKYESVDMAGAFSIIQNTFGIDLKVSSIKANRVISGKQRKRDYLNEREKALGVFEDKWIDRFREMDSLRRMFMPTDPSQPIDVRYGWAVKELGQIEFVLDVYLPRVKLVFEDARRQI